MKTAKWMFWPLLTIFLWSVHTAEAQWGTKTWRSVRGARGAWTMTYNSRTFKSFAVDVPASAGSLTIRTGQDGRGGSGSLDLYVRYGRLPTGTSYLKRKVGPGYRKTITITNPRAGRYYIRIRGRTNYRASLQAKTARKTSMVLIPGGANRGANPLAPGESYDNMYLPTYNLTVSPFYMDKYEVTKALWDEVYAWGSANGYDFLYPGFGKAPNHPVHTVEWYDCVKWCNARSQKEGRPAVYMIDGAVYKTGKPVNVVQTPVAGYRLPTTTEWEYAARGGLRGMRFPWGNLIQHARANYYSSSSFSYDTSSTRGDHPRYYAVYPYTSPVGSFAANGYGLYDMAGNVWEWCFDWYPGFEGIARVIRGGNWQLTAPFCRVGFRFHNPPSSVYPYLGFRTVRSAGP